MKLTDFKALTFDCYGTLIDWETGMIEALQPLTRQIKRFARNYGRESFPHMSCTSRCFV